MKIVLKPRILLSLYIVLNVILFYHTRHSFYSTVLTKYAWLLLLTQCFHSIEEQISGFHNRWPLMKLSAQAFALFEVFFQLFWFLPFVFSKFPGRETMLWFFPLLMFANGVWHVVWFGFFEKGKKYVPGLLTAPVFIFVFIAFYLEILY